MTRICFLDLETTGTDPDRHELWEIGLIVRDPDANQDVPLLDRQPGQGDREYAWQVVPTRMDLADPRALRVGRYYDRIRVTGQGAGYELTVPRTAGGIGRHQPGPDVTANDVAAEVARLIDGSVVVAVNVAFDVWFMEKFLRGHFQCPTWDYHYVEALSLAAGHLKMPPPWTSTAVTDALAVAAEKDRHTGLGDSRIVRDIYDTVYAAA